MRNLNLLVVEGNLQKENENFRKNGKDLNARADLLAAASMGSTAFQKGLGAIHSLSHPVNAQFNVHHGLSNAIFMPYVLTFNKSLIEKKIISICDYLNLDKNFESFLKWILDLRKELNIPHKLSEVVEEKKINLDQLSKMALEDPSTSTNPKKMTIEDMQILYKHSLSILKIFTSKTSETLCGIFSSFLKFKIQFKKLSKFLSKLR